MNIQAEKFTRMSSEPIEPESPKNLRFKAATLAPLLFLIAGPASAALYTVDSSHDPASGNPAACAGAAGTCSLRDALAAADLDPAMDTIVFDVDDTIYLLKQLTVEFPVEIDGGKGTELRVSQDYQIAIFPDRFDDDENGIYEDVPHLQPAYFSVNGTPRPMLELHGPGSSVRNMVIDGSITPLPGDIGVARLDFNSSGVTNHTNRLFSAVDEDGDVRWLVAGGIRVDFTGYGHGPVEISNNELRYFNAVAMQVNVTAYASVTNNTLATGTFEGIQLVDGLFPTIANNMVSDFRKGIVLQQMAAITVRENESFENWRVPGLSGGDGIFIERVDNKVEGIFVGENLVEDNLVFDNAGSGITIAAAGNMTISGNSIESNGVHGIDVKALEFDGQQFPSGYINLFENDVSENGTDNTAHGGIRIAEGAGFNNLVGNKVASNSGFGIVIDHAFLNTVRHNNVRDSAFAGVILLNGSQGNTIAANNVEKNGYGALSFSLTGIYPSYNTIDGNELRNNSEADIADAYEFCANSWTNNKFDTGIGPDGCMN